MEVDDLLGAELEMTWGPGFGGEERSDSYGDGAASWAKLARHYAWVCPFAI